MNETTFEIVELKATDDADAPAGLFAAKVAAFGNKDRNGDRMVRGAFKRTIAEWVKAGHPIPVVLSHQHKDPDAYIGEVDPNDVKETDDGLIVAGKLDVDTNPKARRVWELLKAGRIRNWSFAFAVKKARQGADKVREVLDVDLFEVGPTLIGANPETATLAVKDAELEDDAQNAEEAAGDEPGEQTPQFKFDRAIDEALAPFDEALTSMLEEKVGRVISARTEARIRAALAELQEVLAGIGEEQVQEGSGPEGKAVEDSPADPPGEDEQLRRQLQEAGMFLAGRS